MTAPAKEIPAGFVRLMDGIGLGDLPGALATGEPEVSVRLNTAKGGASFDGAVPVPWCPEGLYLPSRPQFTLDPRLHAGAYYVQEAASMFHAHIVRTLTAGVGHPLRVLDACAAPGGKTTAVMSALPAGSVTVANEYVPARAAALRENIVRWGDPSVIVTRGDTARLGTLREEFDIIVADVPCSGEGMMRKDPQAVAQWSEGLVRDCAALQREITDNLWPALCPGGWMIYSTCTFNRSEDEEQVERLMELYGAESVWIPVDPAWDITPGIDTGAHCCRFIPGRTRGEGLFVAVLRKPGTLTPHTPARDRKSRRDKAPAIPDAVKGWVNGDGMTFMATADRLTAFPALHTDLLRRVAEKADVIHEGVPLATVKGRDLIPAHPLALSTALASGAFPQVALSADEAVAYLRGDAITLPGGTPRGYVAVTYGGLPLGWMKNIGNRANNLYPTSSRIKKL